ncbi:MAG: biopolymer transporter ExbD [Kiritimatiellae bacterium]|nr:biopolymer transporter ExbD [Kiritimatiellia bacterium]
MPKSKRKPPEGCELNMTPMIDVVFQLIIFFVVTLKMTKELNPDIVLEDGKHGETITAENQPTQTIEIEVSRRGRISIHNAQLTRSMLADIIRSRYSRHGSFPVLIRADRRTRHEDVKTVMDICTRNGVWKVGFVAIKDAKTKK